MKDMLKKIYKSILLFVAFATISIGLYSCKAKSNTTSVNEVVAIDENGSYTSKDEVALYIYTYKKLPRNFIKKKDAEKLGWNKKKNNLYEVTGGCSIGGDKFGNYEKILPVVDGRTYYECDIDYKGGKRNAKRIVYADDFNEEYGIVFYTEDHYKTFTKLY
ncbi:MAG: ribonuclease [Lachnospiraceae bacterium]|nr:ribonuclease [Lachnospiraceae bacterium]